jgi:hypothetical protein
VSGHQRAVSVSDDGYAPVTHAPCSECQVSVSDQCRAINKPEASATMGTLRSLTSTFKVLAP